MTVNLDARRSVWQRGRHGVSEGPGAGGTARESGTAEIARNKEGEPLVVIRPENPEPALTAAAVALANDDNELFQRIPEESGPYCFVGYYGKHKDGLYVVDKDGNVVDTIKPGDSIVSKKALTFQKASS